MYSESNTSLREWQKNWHWGYLRLIRDASIGQLVNITSQTLRLCLVPVSDEIGPFRAIFDLRKTHDNREDRSFKSEQKLLFSHNDSSSRFLAIPIYGSTGSVKNTKASYQNSKKDISHQDLKDEQDVADPALGVGVHVAKAECGHRDHGKIECAKESKPAVNGSSVDIEEILDDTWMTKIATDPIDDGKKRCHLISILSFGPL